jgi:hypothetical protein
VLIPLKLDSQGHDVVVNLSISRDLLSQAPVISLGHCHLEDLEVAARASEHVLKPGWQGFDGRVCAMVSLGVEVNDVCLLIGSLCGTVPWDGSVVVETYPLGFLVKPIADRDVEIGDLSVVEDEALWWCVEAVLIMEDALLKVVVLVLISFSGDGGVGLMVGDGL